VTIEKPSELLEFMEIPLVLAQAIVAIPAEVIKVRLASTNNQKLLIDAQRDLLATQRAYVGALRDLRTDATGTTETDGRKLALPASEVGVGRAFQRQPGPDAERKIGDTCTLFCAGSRCTRDACMITAASACQGQELNQCLRVHFP
jgi:hypothetical protein